MIHESTIAMQRDLGGDRRAPQDLVADRLLAPERTAEIAAQDVAHPAQILLVVRAVESQAVADGVDLFVAQRVVQPPSQVIIAIGSPGMTRMAMKISTVTPNAASGMLATVSPAAADRCALAVHLDVRSDTCYPSSQAVSLRPHSTCTRLSSDRPLTLLRHIGECAVKPVTKNGASWSSMSMPA